MELILNQIAQAVVFIHDKLIAHRVSDFFSLASAPKFRQISL